MVWNAKVRSGFSPSFHGHRHIQWGQLNRSNRENRAKRDFAIDGHIPSQTTREEAKARSKTYFSDEIPSLAFTESAQRSYH